MLATHDKSFDNVAQELYKANADDRIRRECEAREEFYFEQRRQQQRMEDFKTEQRRQQRELENLKRDNFAKDQTISSQNQTISSQAAEIARLREKLSMLGLDE